MQSMASSVSVSHSLFLHHNPLLLQTFPSITPGFRALKIDNNKIRVRSYDSDRQYGMRKPSVLHDEEHFSLQRGDSFGISEDDFESSTSHSKRKLKQKEEQWLEWEDQILEETVPLVSFVRMILHSGKYESGDKLSPEHEKTILDKLLSYHPECEKKIGCGIDFITVGYHPDFENSRCLFIVRKDGKLVDFSYWKCIKGLIRKNYPLYADSFILRHFRRGR